MDATVLLLIGAVVCFVFQAFGFVFGTFRPQWWALGVAFYVAAQIHF